MKLRPPQVKALRERREKGKRYHALEVLCAFARARAQMEVENALMQQSLNGANRSHALADFGMQNSQRHGVYNPHTQRWF